MGAFGPFRVVTRDHTHTPSAPYTLSPNQESLLDASDLVFVDAPGTGFGRIAGKDAEKAFWGVDPDAHAFADFIVAFLSRNGRWNSPRFLFGESYGTMRAAVVAGLLQNEDEIDLNGVIMLSSVLSNDLGPDQIGNNPGIDLPYVLALPSYAATAWYHHRLPGSHPDLAAFLRDVERFAQNDYLLALEAGATLDPARRDAIAQSLHDDTGLSVDYIERANLRIDGGEFEQNLLADGLDTTGRLDTRFAGPTLDPLAKEALYDPQSAAISSGYVSAFNDYVRHTLKFGEGQDYRADIEPHDWNFLHEPPGAHDKLQQSTNVMADLASAMIQDPDLHVLLNSGYFDLATPYMEGRYEMQHLPMPRRLQSNIEYKYYASGHMVYVNADALKALHDNVADFIRRYSKPG
jgi:carboxypeptidase C (cathepsin A)